MHTDEAYKAPKYNQDVTLTVEEMTALYQLTGDLSTAPAAPVARSVDIYLGSMHDRLTKLVPDTLALHKELNLEELQARPESYWFLLYCIEKSFNTPAIELPETLKQKIEALALPDIMKQVSDALDEANHYQDAASRRSIFFRKRKCNRRRSFYCGSV